MNHYTLHSLDTDKVKRLTLETADKRYIVAANADELGRKLAETEQAAPNIKLDRHCEEYLPLAAEQILSAYARFKPQVKAQV